MKPSEPDKMVRALKRRAEAYKPLSEMQHGFNKEQYSKRELRQLVEEHFPEATDPDSGPVLDLRDTLRGIEEEVRGIKTMEEQLKIVCNQLDDVFFFGLTRVYTRAKPDQEPLRLVRLKVMKKPASGRLRGGFRHEDNFIRIYVDEELSVGKYIGTLAHEMAHAYLFMFAEDYALDLAPDHGARGAHSSEWGSRAREENWLAQGPHNPGGYDLAGDDNLEGIGNLPEGTYLPQGSRSEDYSSEDLPEDENLPSGAQFPGGEPLGVEGRSGREQGSSKKHRSDKEHGSSKEHHFSKHRSSKENREHRPGKEPHTGGGHHPEGSRRQEGHQHSERKHHNKGGKDDSKGDKERPKSRDNHRPKGKEKERSESIDKHRSDKHRAKGKEKESSSKGKEKESSSKGKEKESSKGREKERSKDEGKHRKHSKR
ncbi:Uu.00g083290.m01.CDS01 [Anthostomella pinea]|uniref:Uu.00g083290.m01.CDS01 n=1 Tax=Anthostomella pinea TaxID=933095 RepID=A0AAI8YJQ6_9PEZI|nr:Uu.00g083290.m01.CDS01 [Anthostomella pinea]